MRKIYSIITLMLFLLVGNAQAQRAWTLSENPVQEVVADTSHYYALQEGFNNLGTWSSSGYLNSKYDDVCSAVDNSCIYNFVRMGQIEVEGEEFPTYILKNVENGLYLCEAGNHYTNKKQEAFVFTIRVAEEKLFEHFGEWIEYSNAAHSERCVGAADAGAIVMCSPTEPKFISFGGNPTFWPYIDTNNWLLYEATEDELSEYEKFCIIYDEYWQNGLNEELYPVGDMPGCISQEYYDRLNALLLKSDELVSDQNRSDEEYMECRKEIIETWGEYDQHVVKLNDGYYVIRSDRGNALLIEQNNNWRTERNIEEIPTEWTIENARYIWKFTADKNNEGRFFFQNFTTGHYTGHGNGGAWPMIDNPEVSMLPIVKKGMFFLIHDGNHYAANNGNGSIVTWDDVNDQGDWFKFIPVDKHVCDSLNELVAQRHRNEQLKGLVDQVKAKMASLKLKNGFTEDGNYYSGSEGLVSDFENLNCQEKVEGPKEAAFDGRPETHFHSVWSSEGPADNDWHWVQLDLGKEVDEIILKLTTRWKNSKNRPTKFSFVVPEGGDINAPVWMDTIFKADTAIYAYNTIYNGIPTDSSTYIQKIKLPKAVQHVRFVVTDTQNKAKNGNAPFWGVGEFRVYDVKDCVENPLYAMIPQELKAACEAEIAKSEAAIENNTANQDLYDALEKAYKMLLEAYPDPAVLNNEIAYAQQLVESADETSEEIGYYHEGAKEAFQAVIDAVKGKIGGTLNLEQLNALRNELKKGMENFTAELIVPEAGKMYLIKNVGEETENDKYVPGSYIHSRNADVDGTPYWNYKNEEDISVRWDAMWIVEKNDKGLYAFKNVANGLYMGNPYEGLTEEEQDKLSVPMTGYSLTPKYFAFRPSFKPGSMLLDMSNGQYLNCDPHGYMVAWGDPRDNHANFSFVNITENEFNESYFINCEKNTTKVVTLPITVNGVYTIDGNPAYKVLGRKENQLILALYEDNELIKAGTPFVLLTGAEDFTFEVTPEISDFEDLFNLTYNYEKVVQNGLVSAPKLIKPGAGYGVLGNRLIEATVEDDVIEAGEGYFNKDIPATEEDGDLQITIEGDIFGEGTGIAADHVVIKSHAATDVYNIAGVKVRSNVKGADALKGLAKGMYIIGGKKVIVK